MGTWPELAFVPTLYSAERARAAADLVRTTWPCQGVTVYPHPTVDRWVRICYSPSKEWQNEPVQLALDKTKARRAKQRTARTAKRVEMGHAG